MAKHPLTTRAKPTKLSKQADRDLDNILSYGIAQFGQTKALKYFDGLSTQLEKIADSPLQYPARENIKAGYRVCSYYSHDIYFKPEVDAILIIRILNRQSIELAIKQGEAEEPF